jgi:hypothetical protein
VIWLIYDQQVARHIGSRRTCGIDRRKVRRHHDILVLAVNETDRNDVFDP